LLLFCLCTPATKYFILFLQFGIWVSRPRQTDRQDLGFKTSIDGQTGSRFQDLDRRTYGIWVSGRQQTDGRNLGFKTSTDGQSGSRFQDLDRRDLGFKTRTDWRTLQPREGSPAASPASPFPHPPKPSSQTQRLTELIY
jgi:hypothetical protein